MAAGKLPQLDRPAVDGTELGQAQLTPSAVLNHSCSSHEQQCHACYSLVCCEMMCPPWYELAISMGFFV
jgi:hypothetical protein